MTTPFSPSWKALILAAGYGTRLLPHTRYLPKPLFTIGNVPVLDIIINQLARAGCAGIVINTHHLHEKIEQHCRGTRYPVPVRLSHEPEILGTGGAMKNNADFFGNTPFVAVNGDIVTDIDFADVYKFHTERASDVALVMHDREEFNSVAVDDNNRVIEFYRAADRKPAGARLLAFTGIHVIHPRVLDELPGPGVYLDIIDVYRGILARGKTIGACIMKGHQWQDIGTPEAYRAAAFTEMTRQALGTAFGGATVTTVDPIPSDGSDTRWFRIGSPKGGLIACDRGLRPTDATSEAESFALINRYLFNKGIAVPKLFLSDPLPGLAFMEDLGDVSLQSAVQAANDDECLRLYRAVIDRLIDLAIMGVEGFKDAWTCQTPSYDRQLIIEKECRYFRNEFLAGYLGQDTGAMDLEPEFQSLADLTLSFSIPGLMHRDMQSRNIMIRDGRPYFIDVQGARRGPVQYDLASLLIDPYVNLPTDIQNRLLDYYQAGLSERLPFDPDHFRKGYACCAVTRNLQVLGAFGCLTRKKGKKQFAPHIPAAVNSLVKNIKAAEKITGENFPKLAAAGIALDAQAPP